MISAARRAFVSAPRGSSALVDMVARRIRRTCGCVCCLRFAATRTAPRRPLDGHALLPRDRAPLPGARTMIEDVSTAATIGADVRPLAPVHAAPTLCVEQVTKSW